MSPRGVTRATTRPGPAPVHTVPMTSGSPDGRADGRADDRADHRADDQAEVEAVLGATRLLVAITARSVAEVDDVVTLPQLRVLVMVHSRGPLNLGSVARGLGVHPSNATRVCDRLVNAGLLHRSDDPTDRRNLLLRLTAGGRELVDGVMDRRRTAIGDVLRQMPAEQRATLVPVLQSFARAGGEVPDSEVWALGWTTDVS